MNQELRCYTFTLYQLSSIQQGIQAGHAAVEMGVKAYHRLTQDRRNDHFNVYHEWASLHKTMVLLNGGDHFELTGFLEFMGKPDNMLVWSPFYESYASLDGILTSIAVIVPERIFKKAEGVRKGTVFPLIDEAGDVFTNWEWDFTLRLAGAQLAR